jgi:hypothetical protein
MRYHCATRAGWRWLRAECTEGLFRATNPKGFARAGQALRDRGDALAPVGVPRSTRRHRPSRSARLAAKRAGRPRRQRVRPVHQLEVQVRSGRVAGVADPSQHPASADPPPSGDRDAARRQVRVQRAGPCGRHDHAVAGKPDGVQPPPRQRRRGPRRPPRPRTGGATGARPRRLRPGRPRRPGPHRPAAPAVVVPRSPADRQPARGPGGMRVEPRGGGRCRPGRGRTAARAGRCRGWGSGAPGSARPTSRPEG